MKKKKLIIEITIGTVSEMVNSMHLQKVINIKVLNSKKYELIMTTVIPTVS